MIKNAHRHIGQTLHEVRIQVRNAQGQTRTEIASVLACSTVEAYEKARIAIDRRLALRKGPRWTRS